MGRWLDGAKVIAAVEQRRVFRQPIRCAILISNYPVGAQKEMNTGWIDPSLLRDFQSEGTDAYRLCTVEEGWVERFGNDVLISFKRVLARERLLEELQTWADWVGFAVRRV